MDVNSKSALILFHIIRESAFSFLGNQTLNQSYRTGQKSILRNLSGTRSIFSKHLLLSPYFEPTSSHDSRNIWTPLSLFCTFGSFSIPEKDNPSKCFVAAIENRFDFKVTSSLISR